MKITTVQELALVSGCCCPVPSCGGPRRECESITGTVASVGFFNNSEDEEIQDPDWTIYTQKGYFSHLSSNGTEYFASDTPTWPDGQVEATRATVGSSFVGEKYTQNFDGSVGVGEDCPLWESSYNEEDCYVEGFREDVGYNRYVYQIGEPPDQYLRYHGPSIARSDVTTLEPADTEIFPPCYYDAYTFITVTSFNWGFNPDGSSAAPTADAGDFQDWIDGGASGDPPCPGSGTVWLGTFDYSGARSLLISAQEGDVGYPLVLDDYGYSDAEDFDGWMSAAVETLDGSMNFSIDAECKGELCSSFETRSERPTVPPWVDIGITRQLARYRMGVPENFSTVEEPRSVWIMQWDEVFFPKEWDAWVDGGMLGDPPLETPELIEERDWTWGGSMDPEDAQFSPWYELAIHEGEGETRPVNVMVKCWTSERIGNLPESWGEIYNFPEPE